MTLAGLTVTETFQVVALGAHLPKQINPCPLLTRRNVFHWWGRWPVFRV